MCSLQIYFQFISLHSHSLLETICDAKAARVKLGKYFAQNSFSAPTQVFKECWSGVPPPPSENGNLVRTWHFGFELGLKYPPPPMTYVGAGVWRLIAVSPKDTVSF